MGKRCNWSRVLLMQVPRNRMKMRKKSVPTKFAADCAHFCRSRKSIIKIFELVNHGSTRASAIADSIRTSAKRVGASMWFLALRPFLENRRRSERMYDILLSSKVHAFRQKKAGHNNNRNHGDACRSLALRPSRH